MGITTLHFGGRRNQTGLARNQVYDGGEKVKIASRVVTVVDELLPNPPEPAASAPASASPTGGELSGEFERLASLHAQGVLDDEEFRAAKARLLGS